MMQRRQPGIGPGQTAMGAQGQPLAQQPQDPRNGAQSGQTTVQRRPAPAPTQVPPPGQQGPFKPLPNAPPNIMSTPAQQPPSPSGYGDGGGLMGASMDPRLTKLLLMLHGQKGPMGGGDGY